LSAAGGQNPNDENKSVPGSAQAQQSENSDANQSDIKEMKRQLAEQQKEIEQLRLVIKGQAESAKNGSTGIATRTQTPSITGSTNRGEVASLSPMLPSGNASATTTVFPPKQAEGGGEDVAPLQLRLGSVFMIPIGFMDFTSVFRDTAPGTNIGTNFGSIPYRTASNVAGNMSEFRLSPQNSRIGARIDTKVKGARVLAYTEADFLGGTGNPPVGNISVSSNSYPLRLRLYWVDVRKGKLEFLGGQTWSLLTPGRQGISPLPADLFYTNVIDVNYQLGLVWGRIPEFRMVYHASPKVHMAVALSNAEQYIGGSGGAGTIVLPTNLATAYGTQLDNGTTTLSVPNMRPDIIAKIAFEPIRSIHFEIGGVERSFKVYNPLTAQYFTTSGGGLQANLNIALTKSFHFITNNYWSNGGGRYIFGQAPDIVVRNDGSLSLVKSGSNVTGFEFSSKNFSLYTYYGGVYIGRDIVYAPNNGTLVGYGFPGSSNSQNRSAQEGTVGYSYTFWKDAKYGALSLMGQYSYFTRNPWFVAPGTPKDTHMNEVWLNLRYTLPGSAPKAE
jgi:hypothetical protein